ncbi:class I SAM-dependent methyltransferase [Candidatus Gracilibacteria bacterium]|nr:class I SAM-dependent methyltransferase [Candidatus Gracilibacteria bacterium]
MVQYDDFADTFGRSRDNLLWPELDGLLTDFTTHFADRDEWRIGDIGCGNGRLLEHIAREPFLDIFTSKKVSYTGLDLSQNLLEQAQKKTQLVSSFENISWVHGDMLDIGTLCSEKIFDSLFFVASFHHLADFQQRLAVLRDAQNLLAPGGRIMMINWNLLHESQTRYSSSRIQSYENGSTDFVIKIGQHQRFYHAFSEQEYQSLAQERGLSLSLLDFGERNSICIFSL